MITEEIANFLKHKRCKNKEAKTGKEYEQIKNVLRVGSSNAENCIDSCFYFF